MEPVTLTIATTSRSYPVILGAGLADRLSETLEGLGVGHRHVLVSSPSVWKFHGRAFKAAVPKGSSILVPDGERHKHLQAVSHLYDALIKAGTDRNTTIIAVGGGVIGDTVGFAAATYLRGLTLVHVPTTLLAQVDSAIGGKVGVNHPLGKNLIGAFHQPAAVIIDPLLLDTLPRREFRAGLYEVVKYGVIASRSLFARLETDLSSLFARDPETLVPVIADSCRIKGDVVARDEREAGLRRVLNFGHTAGHALEAITSYRRFRHGEAIGYGMLVAGQISAARGLLSKTALTRIAHLVQQMGPLPPISDLSAKRALAAIKRDKKVIDGTLHFVLATKIGGTTIASDVTEQELEAALRETGLRR